MTDTTAFTPDIVAAVAAHMNGDHAEDSLLICRSLGGQPAATSAQMTGISPAGAEFSAVVDGASVAVVVPWEGEVTERGHIRAEVVRMYREACAQLGVPPRGESHG